MSALPGHSEAVAVLNTEADETEKYGSDAHLIRFGHGPVFSQKLDDPLCAGLI
ncbi:hypothetical protein LOY57_15800 [Pseudomonas moraviensis]|uniref:hypothetical protein n=1 Tax=Pseudomonas TaxID=286 RepID=UPI0015A7F737|nr:MULTISPECIES: hypothetical protein [Pseudomonas]UVL44174.1 hypothetical protein LOY57_15800 [Pseudomonas moraviensis]